MHQIEAQPLRHPRADRVERVVVGVADSPSGRSALQWAAREADSLGVPLLALRAWSPGSELRAHDTAEVLERRSVLDRAAQQDADRALGLAVGSVGPSRHERTARTRVGYPAEVLLEEARDALVVVGSRGTGAFARHAMGSTTSDVLHHATSRVVVVPPELPSTQGRAPCVLVGVDHSAASLHALEVAADVARRRGHRLVPVTAYQLPTGDLSGVGMYLTDPAPVREAALAALSAAVVASGCSDVVDAPCVVLGHAGHALTSAAEPQDLLVVGSRGHGGFAGLLVGSTSTSCTQHATCPVMVVRAGQTG